MTKPMSFGQKIRELRCQSQLSPTEFAKAADCSNSFLSLIENGRRFPSDRVLGEMAKALGTTISQLKTYDQRPRKKIRKALYKPSFARMFLGQQLRQLRAEKGISVEAVAQKLGCSSNFLYLVEHGRRFPSAAILAEMAEVLGTTPARLEEHDILMQLVGRKLAVDPHFATALRALITSGITHTTSPTLSD